MIIIYVNTLQYKTINSLINENIRFTITNEEEGIMEEENINNVADKVAILREQYLRGNS